ncbi:MULTISPECIES: STAS domain-containing protein [Actinomadura]|uniref:Anti-sigma factor antagonist n=1 Tax=Actinomadura yumaensis TaxID=111807 RepID=A0ABW2CFU6_9ACTN|nr:STAS domain-containing protein [Actinomadura sp. J1-007]MWK35028.1 anti-sigma factor antagonist [Actinomadura sp. J1-007]
MDFDVHLLHHDRCTIVRVQGDIDVVSRGRFEKAMFDVLDAGGPLIVDLREVTFCDSTGLNAIVSANRRAAERGTVLALIAIPPRVERVFRITALDKYLSIHDTLRDALAAMPPTPLR